MKHKRTLALLALLLFSIIRTWAQLPTALPARNGVWVQITKNLRPAREGTRYQIERVEAGQRTWQAVGQTDPVPANPTDLAARLDRLLAKNPIYELPGDSLLARLWVRYGRVGTADSLGVFGLHPLLLEALGVAFFDAGAKAGVRYDYRITAVSKAGRQPLPVTKSVSFPGPKQPFGAKLIRATGTGTDVRMQFLITQPGRNIGLVRVQRGIYGQTTPRDVPTDWGFRVGKKDSLIVEVTDRNVQKRMTYQYTLIPTDMLGNEGTPSELATVTNLRPYVDLPTIMAVKARSDEDRRAVRLSWRLSGNAQAWRAGLRSIEILRSDSFDGPYKPIASMLPTDTAFYDTQVRPVEMRYYQLLVNGNYDQAPASVRVAGMLNASEENRFAPIGLRLDRTKDAIKLTWRRGGANVRGYVVYRGTSVKGEMKAITPVMVTTDSVGTFTQNISELAVAPLYVYAVAEENSSYKIGPLSERVMAGAVVPATVRTPLNVQVISKQTAGRTRALVVWENMKAIDPYVQGYAIYRKAEGEKDVTLLYHQPDDTFTHNTFTDTTVRAGIRYSYRVRAYGFGETMSAPSAEATFYEALPPVLTPLGLRVAALADGKSVRISWDAPAQPSIAKYNLYRYRATGKPTVVANLTATYTQFVDKGADAGGTYFYQIASVGSDGRESNLSDPVGVDW